MTPTDLEQVYEDLAVTLDAVGEDRHALLLAKLALLLAQDLGDAERVKTRIAEAAANLDV